MTFRPASKDIEVHSIVERDWKCTDRGVLNKVTFRLASKDTGVHIIVERNVSAQREMCRTSDLQTSF